MTWDESMIIYAFNRMCDKYRPRRCSQCPVARRGDCNLPTTIDRVKTWSEKNIPAEVLEGRRATDGR